MIESIMEIVLRKGADHFSNYSKYGSCLATGLASALSDKSMGTVDAADKVLECLDKQLQPL